MTPDQRFVPVVPPDMLPVPCATPAHCHDKLQCDTAEVEHITICHHSLHIGKITTSTAMAHAMNI